MALSCQQGLRHRSVAGNRRAAARPSRINVVRVQAGGKVFADPVQKECTAFAPATVANLGPGFDWMGCAVEVGMKSMHTLHACKHGLRKHADAPPSAHHTHPIP